MEDLFIIQARYETFTKNGKQFIDWYNYDTHKYTENDAKERIKKIKQEFGYIDQKTKLNHEYRLYKYEDYIKEFSKEKKDIEKLLKAKEEYYKSDKYKEMQKRKAKSARELKKYQEQYKKDHE